MLVVWAYFIQKDELEYTVKNADDVLYWFDNMKNPVPTWYLENSTILQIAENNSICLYVTFVPLFAPHYILCYY